MCLYWYSLAQAYEVVVSERALFLGGLTENSALFVRKVESLHWLVWLLHSAARQCL